ncbi:hypothetical protein V1478_007150 [Vespula squamosa]|uniref:Uncharacterized protein n=1 Tax=Vespula squamosa TaxID=30214 RepID=A0ABD2B2C1_VESSQ
MLLKAAVTLLMDIKYPTLTGKFEETFGVTRAASLKARKRYLTMRTPALQLINDAMTPKTSMTRMTVVKAVTTTGRKTTRTTTTTTTTRMTATTTMTRMTTMMMMGTR